MGLFESLRRREQPDSTAASPPGRADASRAWVAAPTARAPRELAASQATARLHGQAVAASTRRDRGDGSRASSDDPRAVHRVDVTPAPSSTSAFRESDMVADTVAQFHRLPAYQALLTVGPEAVYQLPPALHDKLIAIDCGARLARLVRATMSAADTLALDGTVKAVKGALRARGYGVAQDLVAESHVLKEILRNAGAVGKGSAKGGPMQLFERWVALAVPSCATDLHIEVRRNTALVRIRVDGRIEPLPDGQGGRYSRKEVIDAIAAGYNSTRVVYHHS